MSSTERAKVAYDTFRLGFKVAVAIPHWDDAPSWVRDVVIVAYLQGKLDCKPPLTRAEIQRNYRERKKHAKSRECHSS